MKLIALVRLITCKYFCLVYLYDDSVWRIVDADDVVELPQGAEQWQTQIKLIMMNYGNGMRRLLFTI